MGFTLAIVLFAGMREKLETAICPPWMQGIPGDADCGRADGRGVLWASQGLI